MFDFVCACEREAVFGRKSSLTITTSFIKLDDYTEHQGVNGGGSYTAQLTGHHHYTTPRHHHHPSSNGDEMMGKYYSSCLPYLSFLSSHIFFFIFIYSLLSFTLIHNTV